MPIDSTKFTGMDAVDNQNAVDARHGRTSDVGSKTIAHGKDARAVVDTD